LRAASFFDENTRLVAVESLKWRKNALFSPDGVFFVRNSDAIPDKKSLISPKNDCFCQFVPHRNKSTF
jgi:hypothetical protein